jgi:ATP synthase, subunit E
MLELSEKLKKFSAEVLGEATETTQKQWETFLQEQKKDYDQKESEYLEDGYTTIQAGLKKLEKEKNSRLSKALMENHQRILQRRTEIVDHIFTELEKRLIDFTQTEEYLSLLRARIRRTIERLGEGKKRIILTVADRQRWPQLADEFADVAWETEKRQTKSGMIGGCQGYQQEGNVFYDDSFAGQIQEQRERFLQGAAAELKIE